MRLGPLIRAVQQKGGIAQNEERLDMQLEELTAMAEAGDKDAERYLRLLMDGQEPTAQYFHGAAPHEPEEGRR